MSEAVQQFVLLARNIQVEPMYVKQRFACGISTPDGTPIYLVNERHEHLHPEPVALIHQHHQWFIDFICALEADFFLGMGAE